MSGSQATVTCPKCSLETTPAVARCHRCGKSLRGKTLRALFVGVVVAALSLCLLSTLAGGIWGVKSGTFLLISLAPGAPLPQVLAAAKHEQPEVRKAALELLGNGYLDEEKATEALFVALGDPSPDCQDQAVWGLANREPGDIVGRLIQLLSSEEVALRQGAMETLVRLGYSSGFKELRPPVVEAALVALEDADPVVRKFAANAIGGGEPSEASRLALSSHLADPSPEVREASASALGAFKEKASESAPALASLLRSESTSGVRRAAASALGRIKSYPEIAVPPLIEALGAEEIEVRRATARALGRFGPLARSAVEALTKRLSAKRSSERLTVALALSKIGASEALGAVEAALERETKPRVRAGLLLARAKLDPSSLAEAVAALVAILKGPEEDDRQRAALCLGELGPDAIAAAPALIEVLEGDTSVWNQATAARALAKLRAESAIPALIKALEDDGYLAITAAKALGAFGPAAEAATGPLEEFAKSKLESHTKAAQEALDLIRK